MFMKKENKSDHDIFLTYKILNFVLYLEKSFFYLTTAYEKHIERINVKHSYIKAITRLDEKSCTCIIFIILHCINPFTFLFCYKFN